ncbi:MAG: DUF4340 domain-containing protein [Gammaproteobacteria bacterium]
MKKLNLTLSVLLVFQIALTAILFTVSGQNSFEMHAGEKLLDLETATVDRIEIVAAGEKPLAFEKKENDWVLPEHYGIKASSEKLTGILDKLTGINKNWPVATSEDAAPRFKVASENFENKIVFSSRGNAIKTLYLGTSPGFRKIHARLDGQNEIYAVAFNGYELSGQADDWIDRSLLNADPTTVVRAEINGLTLNRKDGKWILEGLSENEETDTDAAANLIGNLTSLSYSTVLGREGKAEFKLDKPVISYTLTPESDEAVEYRFGKPDDSGDYVAKSSTQPYYFKIGSRLLEPLLKTARETLVKKQQADAAAEPTGQQPASDP